MDTWGTFEIFSSGREEKLGKASQAERRKCAKAWGCKSQRTWSEDEMCTWSAGYLRERVDGPQPEGSCVPGLGSCRGLGASSGPPAEDVMSLL